MMKIELNKTKFKILLIAFFFNLSLMYPVFLYDPWLEFIRLKKYYPKMTCDTFDAVWAMSGKYKISMDEICAIINSESEFNTNAISYANARGLMQVMPFNYNGPTSDLHKPWVNIEVGTRYYRYCLELANYDRKKALRYYNAGPTSIAANYRNWTYVNEIMHNTNSSPFVNMQEYYTIK